MDKSLDHSPASTIAQKSTPNQSNTDLMNPNLEKVLDIEEPADVAKSHDPEAVPSPLAPIIPGPPPDGGLQAWLAVLGGFCTIFASFGWINCTSNKHRPLLFLAHVARSSSRYSDPPLLLFTRLTCSDMVHQLIRFV
jgi:hypothetical protein